MPLRRRTEPPEPLEHRVDRIIGEQAAAWRRSASFDPSQPVPKEIVEAARKGLGLRSKDLSSRIASAVTARAKADRVVNEALPDGGASHVSDHSAVRASEIANDDLATEIQTIQTGIRSIDF